jgi:hypothetical protein
MISQKCPKCLSSRVRRGYRPTPFWSKMLFRYNLLCDNCNWEFTGFAVPGTVSAKPTRNPKKKPVGKTTQNTNNNPNNFVLHLPEESTQNQHQLENSAAEEISAVEKNIDPPVSGSVDKSSNTAKRKSGV